MNTGQPNFALFGQAKQPRTLDELRANQLKWDRFFLGMAEYVSSASKDPSTKVGAVIVRPDRTVASVGYNGFPRGVSDAEELYNDREVKLARVVHAELNAILSAAEPVRGYTLYVWAPAGPTCDRCGAHVIQAGVSTVVFPTPEESFRERWGKSLDAAVAMYQEAGVQLREVEI